jgi:outer membrane protein OmpA-like peptidoglycan-associated protein
MRMSLMLVGVLALAGTGCATKKYVAKTVAPVEARVTAAEAKDTDQDKKLTDQSKQIEELGTDLSRTKERLNDTDQKAVAAGQAAQQAGQRADNAQRSADGARTLAQQGVEQAQAAQRGVTRAAETMDKVVKLQMLKSETVLFPLSQYKLSAESKAQLDEIAKMTNGQERFAIEVQGFTDKTGSADVNQLLSQQRAAEVVRYLVNEHKIPVRSISSIGSGYASPVADDSTREGRKMNRRVEVRLFVPEIASAATALAQK